MRKLNPLLRLAAISGVEAALKFHILRGDDLDARDSNGATPLILATTRKNKGAVRLLLDAGVNPTLVDLKGMDALAYAIRANCQETVEILTEALNKTTSDSAASESSIAEHQENISNNVSNLSGDQSPEGRFSMMDGMVPAHPELFRPNTTMSLISETSLLSLDDTPLDADFDDGWVVEDATIAPIGDEIVKEVAKNIHTVIGQHKALDLDEDWGDIDLYLPEKIALLERGDVDDALRIFLLSAMREGVVSGEALVELCSNADGSRNEEFDRHISAAVSELGAVVSEQNEICVNDICLDEASLEEKLQLDDAIEFIRELASGLNEPSRLYFKDIGGRLLDAEEEIALSREMEEAWSDALSALAQWPRGLSVLFESAEKVALGEMDAKSFSEEPELSLEEEREFR